MKLTKDDFEIYGLQREPTEWFLRLHSDKGKTGVEQLMEQILKNQEDAEKLQKMDALCPKEQYPNGVSSLFVDILNGKIILDFDGKNEKIVERLKKRIEDILKPDDEQAIETEVRHLILRELQKIVEGDNDKKES